MAKAIKLGLLTSIAVGAKTIRENNHARHQLSHPAQQPHRGSQVMEYRKLAPRQAEALAHRAGGLTNAETAAAMHCSVANVANLLSECFFKLHARNSTDAVAKAVKHGLIHFALLASIISGIGADAQDQLRTRIQRRPTVRTIRIREDLA